MEDFVTFEIAKKLKDIGFECKHPFAMYNEYGIFHALFTSADYHTCESGKYREYYAIEDFDEHDYICPTISQVLKWLGKNKELILNVTHSVTTSKWYYTVFNTDTSESYISRLFDSFEEAAIDEIEYVINNFKII